MVFTDTSNIQVNIKIYLSCFFFQTEMQPENPGLSILRLLEIAV